MHFEYDEAKSTANRKKHGIDFAEAQVLWIGRAADKPLAYPAEARRLRIGMIGERLWAVVYTLRGERVRLISARRARTTEEREYERAAQEDAGDDHQP